MISNIRSKIIALIIFFTLVMIIGVVLLRINNNSKILLLLENQKKEKTKSLDKIIESKSKNLDDFVYDYTYWDEMVDFVKTGDDQWGKENIEVSLTTYHSDVAWVYKPDFTIVQYYKISDSLQFEKYPIPVSELKTLLFKKSFCHFFIQTKYGLMEISGATINSTADVKRERPASGYYFAGRIWNDPYLKEISLLADLELKIIPIKERKSDNYNNKYVISNYKVIKNWQGKPLNNLYFQKEIPFAKSLASQSSDQIFLSTRFAVLILFMMSFILFRYVIKPLNLLTEALDYNDVSKLKKLLKKNNEFGKLAAIINKFFKQKEKLISEIEERKHAESELLAIGAKQSAMIANISDVIAIIDVEEKYFYISPNIEKWFGWEVRDIIGHSFLNNVHKDALTSLRQQVKKILNEQNSAINSEFKYKCKDGTYKWVELNAINKTSDINIRGVLLNFHDITDREKAKEEFLISESRYRTMIEYSNDLIWTVDRENQLTFINTVAEKTTGFRLGELRGKPLSILVKDEDLPVITEKFRRAILGESSSYEVRIKNNDGEIRTLSVNASPIYSLNKVEGVVNFGHDITEIKKAENALIESQARYKTFISQVSEGIYRNEMKNHMPITLPIEEQIDFIYDNLFMAECNSALMGMYEESDINNLLGKYLVEFHGGRHNPVNREAMRIFVQKAYRFSNVTTEELDIEGNKKFFSNNSLGIVEDGFLVRIWGTQTDITELKNTEAELIAAKEKAEEMNRLKTNFLANMSHELRTPLNGILGFAELLKSEIENPMQASMADTIYNSGRRLSETLNLILDLSKAETDRIELNSENVNISQVVKNNLDIYVSAAKKKGIELAAKINEKNLFSRLDENLFTKVLNNLVDNAVKYTIKGSITIEVSKEKTDKGEFSVLKVIDTGIGIQKEKFGLIWEEFRQVSEGLNRGFEGSGLGLTISKKIVMLMDGTILVDSELGVGSTFTIKFPVCKGNTISEPKKVIPTGIKKNSTEKKVFINGKPLLLYVEDDVTNQEVTKLFLKEFFTTEIANDAKSALNMIKKANYDAILMDINLGVGMDGLELAKEIKEFPQYNDVPIIAVTALAMSSDEDEFLTKGCTHYISKPFSREDIIALLWEALKGN